MSSALHEQPYLESWRWMSRQIRCAMDPDEPRLIEHYLAEGRYLACCTATSPWTIADTSLRLLLDTVAAARANIELKQISESQGTAIVDAARGLLQSDFMQHFPVDIFQTGSGTSSNMNANEVIDTLASRLLGEPVNPNDHVNCGQSSNDIIPTTLHVSAALALHEQLLPALVRLVQVIERKADEVHHHVKTGRTHLMDAMPVRMSQVLNGWAQQLKANIGHLQDLLPSLQSLAQGGTAVGTGINAHPQFAARFSEQLSKLTQVQFKPGEDLFALIGSQDTAVSVSGQLKATAVSLMKIANDLRWMNSGPLAALGEIELEALQPGSSIMPGKVNPVIPEATAMVAAQVIGNDTVITIAGQSGNFELNVMLPIIAQNLLTNSSHLLGEKAIASFKVNESRLKEALSRNPILVTALNPIIGYQKAAEIAKKAYQQGRPVIDVALEHTDLSRSQLEVLLDPEKLTAGGV
jgi:fumarate hydratase, class II